MWMISNDHITVIVELSAFCSVFCVGELCSEEEDQLVCGPVWQLHKRQVCAILVLKSACHLEFRQKDKDPAP